VMDKRKPSDSVAMVPAKKAKAGNHQQLVAHAGGGRALVAAVRREKTGKFSLQAFLSTRDCSRAAAQHP
jgi:hypothetical protein